MLYDVEPWSDQPGGEGLLIRTSADGAVDFKLMLANAGEPRTLWRELVPHQPGRLIDQVLAFKDHLVRLERADAEDRIVVRDRSGGEHVIDFAEEAYALSPDPGLEYDTAVLRFVYQSPTTPRQWFDYDMATRERTLLKTQEIPSGHDPERYGVRRLHARAADGAEIPVTVLYRRDAPLDGSAPLLLYGYGAYGLAMDAAFSTRSLSLVDRGWVWATMRPAAC